MENQLIYKQIPAVMADIAAIGKERKNQQQGYSFRGIDDVYNEVHPLLAKHKIFSTSLILEDESVERKSKSGNALFFVRMKIEYTFWAEDGSSVKTVVTGEGMDTGDKASNKAMSVAHKYAIIQLFAIPTEDAKDPEEDSPGVVAEKVVPIKIRQGIINDIAAVMKHNKFTEADREIVRNKIKFIKKDSVLKLLLSEWQAKLEDDFKDDPLPEVKEKPVEEKTPTELFDADVKKAQAEAEHKDMVADIY